MKSVGEVMSISRSFEEAFQKALRIVNIIGFYGTERKYNTRWINKPTIIEYIRLQILIIVEYDIGKYNLTKIDRWYLKKYGK